ncbi:MAG: LamG domain-containing protein [Lentisphaerae bacterium]|nr:LamG domain-containing protein [Lentisphaerota bacterium]
MNKIFLLMFVAMSLFADSVRLPLEKDFHADGGKLEISQSPGDMVFRDKALVLEDRKNELRFTVPDYRGDSGTVIFDFMPINWGGDNQKENIVFLQSTDGTDGNFTLYKYADIPGIWLMTQEKLPDGKFKNQFPVMDRKALIKLENGQYHQIALVWKYGSSVRVFLDGQLIGEAGRAAFFPSDFSTLSVGRYSGAPARKKTAIRELIFDRRPFTDQEIKLYYSRSRDENAQASLTILPLSTATSIQTDGQIGSGEYPVRIPGFLNSATSFDCIPGNSALVLGEDAENVYFGAEIMLPADYRPHSSAVRNDDSAQIASGDLFVLACSAPGGPEKVFSGLYLTVTPNNTVYDAEATVDWGKGSCVRNSESNFNVRSASKISGNKWTVELAIPRNMLPSGDFLLSCGFFLEGIRYTLTPQPVWFDHFQNQALIRRISGLELKTTVYDFNNGTFEQTLALKSQQKGYGTLLFELSSPDYRHSSEGMVVDQFVGEKIEILSGKSFDRAREEFSLAPATPFSGKTRSVLPSPDIYLASTQIKLNDTIAYQRQFIFRSQHSLDLALTPEPSRQVLRVRPLLYGKKGKDCSTLRLTFRRNDQVYHETTLKPDVETEINLSGFLPGSYRLELASLDANGTVLDSIAKKWVLPETEYWRQNASGIAALSPDWCPAPWIPVTRQNERFSVWGRTYDFTGNTFLSQITSLDQLLFQKPALLGFVKQHRVISAEWESIRMKEQVPGRAIWTRDGRMGDLRIRNEMRLEFDGFLVVRMRITPEKPVDVDSLFLEFSLKDIPLMAVQSRRWWQIGEVQDEAWNSFPSIWLGNDHVGINFSAENCKGWWVDSKYPRVELRREKSDGATLKLLIVNRPGRIANELDFTFFVQAGPVKPNFPGATDFRLVGGLGPARGSANAFYVDPRFWSSSYSRPKPLNMARFHDMIQTVHNEGSKLYCYLTPFSISTYEIIPSETPVTRWAESLSKYNKLLKKETNPVLEYFHNATDWNLKPVQFTGDGVAGRETSELAYVNPASSWADYFTGQIEAMLKETDIDGFYFDLPLPQENFDERMGLSYSTRDGLTEGTVQLLAARDLYKRLYYLFSQYRSGRHPWLITHHIRELYPINAFSDLELHGEGVKPRRAFEYSDIYNQRNIKGTPVARTDTSNMISNPSPGFRAAHGGTHSIPSIVLPQYGYDPALGSDPRLAWELLGWTLSYGALLWPVYIHTQTVLDFWKKLEQSKILKDAEFSSLSPDSLQIGFYRQKSSGKTLLILFNPSPKMVIWPVPEKYQPLADFEKGGNVSETVTVTPCDFVALVSGN